MRPMDGSSVPLPQTPLTRGIVKNRHIFWIVLAVFYLLAFNGQWRVGRDSALYRGLGHSLATGKGYTFGEFGSRQIYPGFPVLLAGLEKLFGPRDLPPILLMNLMSLGCLIVTYKLVRLRFPEWVAVVVTFAVGINGWYMELSEELLADIPFLLGMLIALYGWERLRSDDSPKVGPLACLFAGIALAALMRPTFWILAIAWVLVCAWGLISDAPKRRFYATCLAVLIVVWFAIALADPRVRGFHPLAGGYERDAIDAARGVAASLLTNFYKMFNAELAYAFFGQKWLPGMTEVMNAVAVVAAILLWRVNPLWTLLILLTVAVTLIMGPVPRYYAMVTPLMMLSWVLLTVEVARRVPHRWLEVAITAGVLAVVLPNVARCGKVIGQQRGWNGGEDKWAEVKAMSRRVAELVPPGEKVIAPAPSIMAYFSGRDVAVHRDILPDPRKKSELNWPAHLAALNIRYAVFPSKLYKEGEYKIRELMDKGVIVPTERVAREGELALMRIEIRVPPPGQDWRKRSPTLVPVSAKTTVVGTTRPSSAQLAAKQKRAAAARKAVAQRKAVALAKQKRLDKERRLRREAMARAAARERRARHAKHRAAAKPAATKPAVTQPGAMLPRDHLDVGGFSGQSVASRSDSICSRVNLREPWSIPWQRFPAASQFLRLDRLPSQNGQVRHCSGRTA